MQHHVCDILAPILPPSVRNDSVSCYLRNTLASPSNWQNRLRMPQFVDYFCDCSGFRRWCAPVTAEIAWRVSGGVDAMRAKVHQLTGIPHFPAINRRNLIWRGRCNHDITQFIRIILRTYLYIYIPLQCTLETL